MNTLPKDVIELITNKLTPREFFNYCKSETGQQFCSRKEIWVRRIENDFGFLLRGRNKDLLLLNYQIDPKQAYLSLFTKTSFAAEAIKANILKILGVPFTKLMREDYPSMLYEFFFHYLLKMINELDTTHIENVYILSNNYLWKHREWLHLLPEKMFGGIMSQMWNAEIGDVAYNYVNEVFRS